MKTTDVREIRKSRKLTQQQLSNITGFNLRTIQKWEGSERVMSKWSKLDFMLKIEAYDKKLTGIEVSNEKIV